MLGLMRYGIVDHSGHGLHDIWGVSNTTTMAVLSMTYVAAFAIGLLAVSIRVFKRTAVS